MEHSAVVALLSYPTAGNVPFSKGSRWIWQSCLLMLAVLMQPRFCSDVVTPVKKANAVLCSVSLNDWKKAAEDKLIQTLPEELQMQSP